MEAVAKQFDDNRRTGKSTVDAHQLGAGPGKHDLGVGSWQSGVVNESQILTLQPTLPAACDRLADERPQQSRQSVSTTPAQRGDSSVDKALRDESIAKGAVEARRESSAVEDSREFDERAHGTGHRQAIDLAAVDRVDRVRAMEPDVRTREVPIGWH